MEPYEMQPIGSSGNKKKLLGLFVVLTIVAAVPLTIYFAQQRTSYQQEASGADGDLHQLIRELLPDGTEDTIMERFRERYRGTRSQAIYNMYKVCRSNDTPKKCKFRLFGFISPTLAQPTPQGTTILPGQSTPTVNQTETTTNSTGNQGPMTLLLSLCPHGLGSCGDNSSDSGGNTAPVHKNRSITVILFNSNNQAVGTYTTSATYSETTKNFSATVTTSPLAPGAYRGKVQMSGYLSSTLPGILSLTPGQPTTLPLIYLIAGDINGDNALNNQDYTLFMECLNASCPSNHMLASDLDDNGTVEAIDYNLFLRELGAQKGAN